jgi:uncharacterized tellurite resistance protein B-like protein
MGFFSSLMGSDSASQTFNEQEAFMGVLLAVIAADGYFSDEEVDDFWKTLGRAKVMANYTDRQYKDSMTKLMKIVKGPGHEVLLTQAIAALPATLREGVFVYACDLVFADGSAAPEEQHVLDRIKSELSIDDALAYKAAEVVIIKNKV